LALHERSHALDLDTRINQFQSLIESDPDNDMAHFSLGNALLQAERFGEAAASFVRCTEINPGMTKGYELAGRSYIDSGEQDLAKEILTKGYVEAVTRGDMLPKKAIEGMLTEIDAPIPEVVQTATETEDAAGGDFRCGKTGKMGHQMARAPFRNGMGRWIHENISKETFDEWIMMGTKIINELRLDLSRDEHDAAYDYAMRLYLGLTDEIYQSVMDGAAPPEPDGQFKGVIDDIMAMGGHLESEQGNLHTRVE
jgi:Fe-S cluster biosynthesis and repair protein YggX